MSVLSEIKIVRGGKEYAVTGALTVNSARAIDERFFREHFRQHWVIAMASPGEDASGILLALDGDLSFPKIQSGGDSRGEAESAHHPMRCLRSSTCLQPS